VVGKRLRLIDAVELAKYTADSGPDLLAGAIRAHGRLRSPKEYQRQKLCIVPDTGSNAAAIASASFPIARVPVS
jgi:hypothetical protein